MFLPPPTRMQSNSPESTRGTWLKRLDDWVGQLGQGFYWRSRRGFLALLLLIALVGVTAWCGHEAWVYDHWWIPLSLCAPGLIVLLAGRPRTATDGEPGERGWLVPGYAAVLCITDLVVAVSPHNRFTPPVFAIILAPLVWAGVTQLGRGGWARAVGAWLVLFGQYFALIYNAAHSASGIGCHTAWVY